MVNKAAVGGFFGLLGTACALTSRSPEPRQHSDPIAVAAEAVAQTAEIEPVEVSVVAQPQPSSQARWDETDVGSGRVPQAAPFPGRQQVTVAELVDELEVVAEQMEQAPALKDDYSAFVADYGLRPTDELLRDYVRVRLAFEATRDGGLWYLTWKITNRSPNSDEIWKQWRALRDPIDPDVPATTAFAECDELSALFAFFARRLGVDGVGLFWPRWNHVVAVWTVRDSDREVRVVVPTSQIFLSPDASLGTAGFDPYKQKRIYTYRRKDVSRTHRIDADLARFFVHQVRNHAHLSQLELQRRRNDRALRIAGLEPSEPPSRR